jgi:hypothetical protein
VARRPPTDDTAALRCIDQVDINQARLRFLLRHMHVVCAHLSDGGRQAVIMQSDAGPED